MVRALICYAGHQWFKVNPQVKLGVHAHCPPSTNLLPGGRAGELKAARK